MTDNRGSDSASSLPTGERMWPSKHYAEIYQRSLQDPEGFWGCPPALESPQDWGI